MLTTVATRSIWFLLITHIPMLGWIFVGLGVVCAVGLFLSGLSASIHGVAHEAGAMWAPLLSWLPPGLRDHRGIRWMLGFLAFVVLNVSLHWLMRP